MPDDVFPGRWRALAVCTSAGVMARESEDGPTSSDDDEQQPDDEDARHCDRGYGSSGRSHAGHTHH